jgi:hypothetical protein
MIFTGSGRFNPTSFYDGRPAWHFDDDRPNITSFTAGGWRTLHTLFQAWADGVVDEFRDLGGGERGKLGFVCVARGVLGLLGGVCAPAVWGWAR